MQLDGTSVGKSPRSNQSKHGFHKVGEGISGLEGISPSFRSPSGRFFQQQYSVGNFKVGYVCAPPNIC